MTTVQFTIPGGPEKGVPVDQASPQTLAYWVDRVSKSLHAGESRNAARDEQFLQAMRSAAARQNTPGAQRGAGTDAAARSRTQTRENAPQRPRAPEAPAPLAVRAEVNKLSGSYSSRDAVLGMMNSASAVAHLVTPQTSCGELPAGCAIQASAVFIDVNKETYGIPHPSSDDRGLDKTALAKIAAAAGVDWDAELTCRLDDGSNAHYVHFRAVGRVRNFDGSIRTEVGSVEMDLREGSEVQRETDARAAKNNKDNTELPLMRKFILRHAESKAMNRVIRRLGVRTKYSRQELEKPFVVAKLAFTGQTDDPELKRLFAAKIADTFLASHNTLYAPRPTQALAAGHAPPPLDAGAEEEDIPAGAAAAGDDDLPYDDDDDQSDGYDHDTGEFIDEQGRQHGHGQQQSLKV